MRQYYSKAYCDVCETMTDAYRKWGGIEAEETGMVNVTGEMTKAILAKFVENGWLNDDGIEALEPPKP